MPGRRLEVTLSADASRFRREMQEAGTIVQQFGRRASRVGRSLTTFLSGPLLLAGGAAVKMASDAEEAANKFRTVLGSMKSAIGASAWVSPVPHFRARSRQGHYTGAVGQRPR